MDPNERIARLFDFLGKKHNEVAELLQSSTDPKHAHGNKALALRLAVQCPQHRLGTSDLADVIAQDGQMCVEHITAHTPGAIVAASSHKANTALIN